MRAIRSLSGGEKARFVLAQLAAEKPALLVLDEPTNHLDLDMRDALALALQAYAGAVLIVAHDRDLLEKIVDDLWVVQNGTLLTYEGNLEEYTAGRLSMSSSEPALPRLKHLRCPKRSASGASRLPERPRAFEKAREGSRKRVRA